MELFRLAMVVSVLLVLTSCTTKDINLKELDYEQIKNEMECGRTGFNARILTEIEPSRTINNTVKYLEFEDGKMSEESYSLMLYQPMIDFTELFPDVAPETIVFDNLGVYSKFVMTEFYDHFLYFQISENDDDMRVLQYDLKTGNTKIVYTYVGNWQFAVAAVNDRYMIWLEDHNANWKLVSLHCYDFQTGDDIQFFDYSCDPVTGVMFQWNFNEIILKDGLVYFDDASSATDMDLYEYDIENDKLTLISKQRATEPLPYHTLSWVGFDETLQEYTIINIDKDYDILPIGSEYLRLNASENLIAIRPSDSHALFYYDGDITYPLLRSSAPIDKVSCTDSFIAWDGWIHDKPLFYDVKRKALVYMDCFDAGIRYVGMVNDQYLLFERFQYVETLYGRLPTTLDTVSFSVILIDDLK